MFTKQRIFAIRQQRTNSVYQQSCPNKVCLKKPLFNMKQAVPRLTDSNFSSVTAQEKENYQGCCDGLLQQVLRCGSNSKRHHSNWLQKWPFGFSLILYILYSFYIFTIRHDFTKVNLYIFYFFRLVF